MATKHGRKGAIYVGATNGAAAVALSGKTKWSVNFSTDFVETTAFGDTSKTYLAGLPDGTVAFEGFYNFGADALFTAASDGLARNFYLYPDSSDTTTYFFGTGVIDVNLDVAVGDAVKISANIKPRTSLCYSATIT